MSHLPLGPQARARRPKRPRSPFGAYCESARAAAAAADPAATAAVITKKLGELWLGMDEESRAEFAEASAADVARYLDECEKVGAPPGPPGVTIDEIARPISAAQACEPALRTTMCVHRLRSILGTCACTQLWMCAAAVQDRVRGDDRRVGRC